MKKDWMKPKVEIVTLEFDKEMDTACHVAYPSSATPTSGHCNVCGASECWSSGNRTYSNGPC